MAGDENAQEDLREANAVTDSTDGRLPNWRTGLVSCAPVSQGPPAISIGLAVRNGKSVIGRCIESILSQDFADLELVICDNVSDDGTIAALEDYARSDPRQHRLAAEHEPDTRALPRHVLPLDQRR
jgi:cellulose synthase/poly-beta-1,6-N-acetylglucosamine synthase-like glycosyltransferase